MVEGDTGDVLSLAEVEQAVRSAAPLLGDGAFEVATMPYVDPGRFETASLDTDALAATQVAIIPENVSFMEKSDSFDENPVAEQRSKDTLRAQEVMLIEQELLAYYADPAHDVRPEALTKRGGAGSA